MLVKVGILYTEKSKGLIDCIKRSIFACEERGFTLQFINATGLENNKLPACDIVLIDGYCATENILEVYKKTPIAILEKADSCSVFFRDLCKDKRVDMIVKVSKLVKANENMVNYRFEDCMSGAPFQPSSQINKLEEKHLKKVVCGPSFFSYNCLESWQNLDVDLDKPRAVDIHCVLSTENYTDNTKKRRKRVLNICKEMQSKQGLNCILGEGRPYSQSVYREQILDSKIVIAPYGNGFLSYRAAEAMLGGAVLIMPVSDFAHVSGNPLDEWKTYVPCKWDYKDLQDKINAVLGDFLSYKTMRQAALYKAREVWSADFVAQNIVRICTDLYMLVDNGKGAKG